MICLHVIPQIYLFNLGNGKDHPSTQDLNPVELNTGIVGSIHSHLTLEKYVRFLHSFAVLFIYLLAGCQHM